jgi:hypothetical protein
MWIDVHPCNIVLNNLGWPDFKHIILVKMSLTLHTKECNVRYVYETHNHNMKFAWDVYAMWDHWRHYAGFTPTKTFVAH